MGERVGSGIDLRLGLWVGEGRVVERRGMGLAGQGLGWEHDEMRGRRRFGWVGEQRFVFVVRWR